MPKLAARITKVLGSVLICKTGHWLRSYHCTTYLETRPLNRLPHLDLQG